MLQLRGHRYPGAQRYRSSGAVWRSPGSMLLHSRRLLLRVIWLRRQSEVGKVSRKY